MLNFDADVKNTTARHQCENPFKPLPNTPVKGFSHWLTHAVVFWADVKISFDADVKNTTARHPCETRFGRVIIQRVPGRPFLTEITQRISSARR